MLPALNKEFLVVACGPAPPAGALGCAGVLLLASLDASLLLPKPPKGLAPVVACVGVEPGAAPPKRFGVDDVDAGFAAPLKRDGVVLFPDPAWPNKLVPGGGPAGVVEGREKVLFGAGVAAGVDESAKLLALL